MSKEITLNEKKNNDPILSIIEKLSCDPNFDVSKMKAIVEMRDNEINRHAKMEFSKDFSLMQGEMESVVSTRYNDQTKSKYTDLKDIIKSIQPIMAKYSFSVSTKIMSQDNNHVRVKATLYHVSGYEDTTELSIPVDDKGIAGKKNKTDIHGIGSAITYARRYAICMLLNIPTGDDKDGNIRQQVKYLNDDQIKNLIDLFEKSNTDKDHFIKNVVKCDTIFDIPEIKYNNIVKKLNQKIEGLKNETS